MIEVKVSDAQWAELQAAEAQEKMLNERKSLIARFVLLAQATGDEIVKAFQEGRVRYGEQSIVIDDPVTPDADSPHV